MIHFALPRSRYSDKKCTVQALYMSDVRVGRPAKRTLNTDIMKDVI